MTVGKTLWLIVLIKLFVLFAILKVFFFRPALQGTDEQKVLQARKNLIEFATEEIAASDGRRGKVEGKR